MCEIRQFEKQVRSQFGEDGIIEELLARTGTTGLAVEVGSHYEYGNCYWLAEKGWDTLFVDASRHYITALMEKYSLPHVSYKLVRVTRENVNKVVPAETQFLSIDIDGNDYWVWDALKHTPPVVVIEFNWLFPPPERKTIKYDPDFVWDMTTYQGASLQAIYELGLTKGYIFVGTDSFQSTACFVRRDVGKGVFKPETPKDVWYGPGWSHPVSPRAMQDLPPARPFMLL